MQTTFTGGNAISGTLYSKNLQERETPDRPRPGYCVFSISAPPPPSSQKKIQLMLQQVSKHVKFIFQNFMSESERRRNMYWREHKSKCLLHIRTHSLSILVNNLITPNIDFVPGFLTKASNPVSFIDIIYY